MASTDMDVVKTDIEGLDEMLGGGFPRGHAILVAGGPGTGKTSFCMEFLYRGALKGEGCVYITLEETKDNIVKHARAVFAKLPKLDDIMGEKIQTIEVLKSDRIDIPSVINIIRTKVIAKKAKRLVIDSGTILRLFYKSDIEFRKNFYNLLDTLDKAGCTTLIAGEMASAERAGLTFGVEEFLVDGIVMLYNLELKNKRVNALEVMKMRAMDHKKNVVPFRITNTGLKVFAKETIF